jgi:hypothetical protein
MKTISGPEAVDMLERVVAKRGEDFMYHGVGMEESCQYVDFDGPSCGVGLVLSYLGVSDRTLSALDDDFDGESAFQNEPIQRFLHEVSSLDFDEKAVRILSTFQRFQDHGTEYGLALTYAKDQLD